MLPRQFYVAVVQSRGEAELKKAGWLLPLYLVLINIFVVPIAFAGLALVGSGTNADLYIVSLPLSQGNDAMAMLALIGGLSAATAMVIVATVALSIMISNDLVIPLFVRRQLAPDYSGREDWTRRVLIVRRVAIFLIMLAALVYHGHMAGTAQLASIGLMSFAAIAQFAPPMLGGLVWRRANARGAVLGMCAGIAVWAYTLLLPSLVPGSDLVAHGLFGLEALKPEGLFGTGGNAAEPRRPVELVGQCALLRIGVAVACFRAARAHPGGHLRAARGAPDFGAVALPGHGHGGRAARHRGPLCRRGAHRAILPEF